MCEYGQYFRQCREERGLTQSELVAQLREAGYHITLRRYQRMEENTSTIYANDLLWVGRILHVTVDRLVGL